MFLNLYRQKTGENFQGAIEQTLSSFLNGFKNYEKKVLKQWQQQINSEQGISSIQQSFVVGKQRINTGLVPKDFLNAKDKATAKRILAKGFEKGLSDYFNKTSKSAAERVKNFTMQHVGGVVQKGFTFKGARMIRSDIAFTQTKKIPENMELSYALDSDLQAKALLYNNQKELEGQVISLLSRHYLDPNTFVGGFSLKNYSESISYTSSEALREEVNMAISKVYNPAFADLYMKYVLSKHIIAITSPTVLGLITNKEFKWMSDLLKEKYYVFHLRKDLDHGNFFVNNSSIYLQNQKKRQGVYSTWKSGIKQELEPFDFFIKEEIR